MTYYTIGALFTKDFGHVLLIKKTKPEWQKDRLNFPGGHVEDGEDYAACVSREFKEETDLNIDPNDWRFIGIIEGQDYTVGFLTAIYDPEIHGKWGQMTEEIPRWAKVEQLHFFKVISNLYWLVLFAMNYWNPDANDRIKFGTFKYENK